MKITIRLYRRHDMDLLALYKNPDFKFQKALKESLRAYVKKEPYLIFQPEANLNLSRFEFKYGYQMFLILDDTYDTEIIEWLRNVKPGLRNGLIKSILRGSLVGPSVYACLKNDTDRQESNALMKLIRDCCSGILEPPQKGKRETAKTKNNAVKQEKRKKHDSPIKKELVSSVSEEDPFALLNNQSSYESLPEQKEKDEDEKYDIFGDINFMLQNF